MGFYEKLKEFFSEDESWKQKRPIEFEGKIYGAWIPEEDKRAVWPNDTCAKCRGVMLKKEMYWNKETDTWYHLECLKSVSEKK